MINDHNLIQAISNILGWGDMMSHIAIPAIQSIVKQYVWQISECHGVSYEDVEKHIFEDITKLSSDKLWRILIEDYCEDLNPDPILIDGKESIEHLMFKGFDFETSVRIFEFQNEFDLEELQQHGTENESKDFHNLCEKSW